MAPRSVSPCLSTTQPSPVGRRARKRQSRRSGITHKRCGNICTRLAERELAALVATYEVKASPEDVQVILPVSLDPTTQRSEQLPDGLVISLPDASKDNELPVHDASNDIVASDSFRSGRFEVSVTESNAEFHSVPEEPLAPEVPIPEIPRREKCINFNLSAITIHEIIPYAELYGAHPRTFVFDKDSQMIPAARGGYVSANFTIDSDDELDDDEEECDDGGWESWLLEQEDDDYQEFDKSSDSESDCGEMDTSPSQTLVDQSCLPDLDDEAGWEAWLDSTLGGAQEEFSDDLVQCA